MADAKPTQPANGGTSAPSASPANNAATNQAQAKQGGGSQSASTPEGGTAHKVSSTGHLSALHLIPCTTLSWGSGSSSRPTPAALYHISSYLTSSRDIVLTRCHGSFSPLVLPPMPRMLIASHEHVTDPIHRIVMSREDVSQTTSCRPQGRARSSVLSVFAVQSILPPSRSAS